MKNWVEVQLEMDNISRKDIYSMDSQGKITIDLSKFKLFNSSEYKHQLEKIKIKNLHIWAEEMLIFDISCGAKAMFNAFVEQFKDKEIKATLFFPDTTGCITLQSTPQIG